MTEPRRLGVFVCQCGGNISDYVDTERIREQVEKDGNVVAAHVQMFTCSDASQQEIVKEIREKRLDGIVVCSCSPKLHTATFRAAAQRGGLNPYEYTQVNLREQCSWAHTHDKPAATEKALRLVRAGIARTALSEPLERMKVETTPQVLVIGAGVAGLRAALALSDMGIAVHIIDKASTAGGHVARWGQTFPNEKVGRDLISTLLDQVRRRENVTLYLATELVEKSGRIGEFSVKLRPPTGDQISLTVGSIVVATGFDPYTPPPGEFGYGLDGVVLLPEFKELLATNPPQIQYRGKDVHSIAYVYCVGSREPGTKDAAHSYCSRFCCSATSHLAATVNGIDPSLRQFHLFRDVRTYGKYESLYERARNAGSVFLRYHEDEPPIVSAGNDGLVLRVKDYLMAGEEVEMHPDLVVLVTGMVPRENAELVRVLKLPLGQDGFFHEVHAKLRPVETVVDGVFIAGTAQGPKNIAETVASSMAAVSKAGALLLKGYVELDPMVARVDPDKCVWCDACQAACPYGAIEPVDYAGKSVARINNVLCKGEGACVPVCPKEAVEVRGYANAQVTAMIDALAQEAA
jgi:heterodisulfide reductase subunit A2